MTRSPAVFAAVLALGACSASTATTNAPGRATAPMPDSCCPDDALAAGLRIAERYRVDAIPARRFTHAEFWRAVAPSTSSDGFRTEEIGRSILGRELRSVTFGQGPTTVLLWSQMHGDESTATMALADIFRFLAEAEDDALRERLRTGLTITFVPMLNPDGAELFQRENAAGIDINRDARRLATPEAGALKGMHDRLRPQFGFNLHDQSARTRAGRNGLQAAIALLAPAYDEAQSYNEVRSRARLVAAGIARTLAGEIPGRVAKYDESYGARAFGDGMQKWGTSTVLIESGALPDDPQKQRLRALNVVAILQALDAIATKRYTAADPQIYEALPSNAGGASDLLVLGGQLVLPGQPPLPADVAINFGDPVARVDGEVREVGDLRDAMAIDTVDATGLFLHPDSTALTAESGGVWLQVGAPAAIELRRGPDATSELVRRLGAVTRR